MGRFCRAGSIRQPLVIGWGRQDRVCFPSQAERALDLFPDADLHWFERSGHFPQLDAPEETTQLILDVTNGTYRPQQVDVSEETIILKTNQREPNLIGASTAVLVAVSLFVIVRAFS